jgi:hypothetical protein
MKTSFHAKSFSAVLTAFVVLGSSTALLASPESRKVAQDTPPATEAAPPLPAAPPPAAPPVEIVPVPVAPPAEPVAPSHEAADTGSSPAPAPEPAAAATPVTEVGFQRLPDSAYPEPQTRGLKYGSLWLTFHGLQWPYLPAKAGRDRFVVGLSGWGWLDTSYATYHPWGADAVAVGADKINYWKQQGRMLLRVTPTYSFDNWFVQGQVELVGTEDQTIQRSDVGGADTDDLWLRVGQWNSWDFMIGRFEGWEVFHLGMGLDQNTFERSGAVLTSEYGQIQFYGLTDNQFRPSGAAGNAAIHYYPLPYLRFEGLTSVGSSNGGPMIATRPVGILDLGWLKLKGGVEWQRVTSQQTTSEAETTSKGVGGAVQFVFEPHIEFGLNAAQGTVVAVDMTGNADPKNSYTRTSFGGFANLSNGSAKHPLMFGLGGLYTHKVDQNNKQNLNLVDDYWLWQSFVAVQYVMFNQLYIKLVGSYSRAHFLEAKQTAVTYDNEVYSARLRFAFYF